MKGKRRGPPLGSANNQHGAAPKTSAIQIRVTPAQHAALKRAAGNQKLSAWALATLLPHASCQRCRYEFGDDWLDDGQVCPRCLLVD